MSPDGIVSLHQNDFFKCCTLPNKEWPQVPTSNAQQESTVHYDDDAVRESHIGHAAVRMDGSGTGPSAGAACLQEASKEEAGESMDHVLRDKVEAARQVRLHSGFLVSQRSSIDPCGLLSNATTVLLGCYFRSCSQYKLFISLQECTCTVLASSDQS